MSHALSVSRRTLVAVALMALLLAVALVAAGPAHHVLGGQTWNKHGSTPTAGQTWNKPSRVLAGQTWNKQGGGGQTWN